MLLLIANIYAQLTDLFLQLFVFKKRNQLECITQVIDTLAFLLNWYFHTEDSNNTIYWRIQAYKHPNWVLKTNDLTESNTIISQNLITQKSYVNSRETLTINDTNCIHFK